MAHAWGFAKEWHSNALIKLHNMIYKSSRSIVKTSERLICFLPWRTRTGSTSAAPSLAPVATAQTPNLWRYEQRRSFQKSWNWLKMNEIESDWQIDRLIFDGTWIKSKWSSNQIASGRERNSIWQNAANDRGSEDPKRRWNCASGGHASHALPIHPNPTFAWDGVKASLNNCSQSSPVVLKHMQTSIIF